MTDIREILTRIESLRHELGKEFEKYIDNKCVDSNVIEMSRKLDVLIVDYIKEMADCHEK